MSFPKHSCVLSPSRKHFPNAMAYFSKAVPSIKDKMVIVKIMDFEEGVQAVSFL